MYYYNFVSVALAPCHLFRLKSETGHPSRKLYEAGVFFAAASTDRCLGKVRFYLLAHVEIDQAVPQLALLFWQDVRREVIRVYGIRVIWYFLRSYCSIYVLKEGCCDVGVSNAYTKSPIMSQLTTPL